MPTSESPTWNDVAAHYQDAHERYARMRPTMAVMLRLVATLRDEPRLGRVEMHLSHYNLMLWRHPRPTHRVGVLWSEPDGWGWAGETGFVVFIRGSHLEVLEKVIVDEAAIVDTIVDYLHRVEELESK